MSEIENTVLNASAATAVAVAGRAEESTDIAIIDERTIRDKIYEIRGVKVMLDFELAQIYGYETKNFNRQVKNNAVKFEGDEFMFRLTRSEVDDLVRCKNFTSRVETLFKGQSGGSRYLPYAFTEQGVYMLMTVLRGDLAVRQSRALVMAFKAMKDYIVENQSLVSQRDLLRISMQTAENTEAIRQVQLMMREHDDKLADVLEQLGDTVKSSEISPFLLDFSKPEDQREYLLMNGQPAKADETYIDIYSRAKHTIFIVDNYINIKTLRLLQDVQPGVTVTVFSDNIRNMLHASDYADFQVEFPNVPVAFQTAAGLMHDRFIVLDYGTPDEKMYHCGASSKDAGVSRTTAISEFTSAEMKTSMHTLINKLMANPLLALR